MSLQWSSDGGGPVGPHYEYEGFAPHLHSGRDLLGLLGLLLEWLLDLGAGHRVAQRQPEPDMEAGGLSAITRASCRLSAVGCDRGALFAGMNVDLDDDPYSTCAEVEVG